MSIRVDRPLDASDLGDIGLGEIGLGEIGLGDIGIGFTAKQ